MATIETLLKQEIEDEFDGLGHIELGSNEYKTTVDGLTKLVDRAIELEKLNIEDEKRLEAQKDKEFENELKIKQMESERKDQKAKNYIAVAGIVVPVVVTVWGTLKSFKFEETGTVTTIMGRGFINKLLPKK